MQTTAKATRRVLSQIITIYTSVLEFSLEKMWVEVIVKHNKDPEAMLDDINAKLIDVCEEYLRDKKIWLDKYQLSTIVMDLYTQTISSLDAPYKVIAKENKVLIQEYLEKNKSKREALERIKKENESLDRETQALDQQLKEKQRQAKNKKVELAMKQEVPSGEDEVGAPGLLPPVEKSAPKKKSKVKYRWTWTSDLLAVSDFKFPML